MMKSEKQEEEDRWARTCSRDLAILKYYLVKKVAGEPVPALNVEVDMERDGRALVEPSQIIFYAMTMTDYYYPMYIIKKKVDLNDISQKWTMKVPYIDERINIEEEAGKGTWIFQNRVQVHEDDQYMFPFNNKSELIGFRRDFKYSNNNRWQLHMYFLNYPSSFSDDHQEEWVVYRLMKNEIIHE